MATNDPNNSAVEERPVTPLMTWEEYENGKKGQLNLPAFTDMPTLAERAFVQFAREWRISVLATGERTKAVGTREETCVLACLSLANRWGRAFTAIPEQLATANRNTYRGGHPFRWLDDLAWSFCLLALSPQEVRHDLGPPVLTLVNNLTHGGSQVRGWIMTLAWLCLKNISPLYRKSAVDGLLTNVADKLLYVNESAILAARFFLTQADFLNYARQFAPPADFETQYHSRMKALEIVPTCAFFLETENDCYQAISEKLLKTRVVPYQPPSEFEGDLFSHLNKGSHS